MSVRDLAIAIIVFVGLTVLGAWFSIHFGGTGLNDILALSELPPSLLVGLMVFPFLIYFADVLRFLLFSRIFGINLSVNTAINAVIANLFFGWITPSAVMGVPAAIYVLGRSNISWEASFIICTAKSMSGLALLLLLSLVLLGLGHGPQLEGLYLYPILYVTFMICFLFVVAPLLGSLYPKPILRYLGGLADKIANRSFPFKRALEKSLSFLQRTVVRLELLSKADKRLLFLSVALHIVYFSFFMLPGAFLCQHYGADFWQGLIYSIIHKAFSFVAPTPGGSGLTEATSIPFYGDIVPANKALAVVLAFRFYTFYFQIGFGLIYFLLNKRAYSLIGAKIPTKSPEN